MPSHAAVHDDLPDCDASNFQHNQPARTRICQSLAMLRFLKRKREDAVGQSCPAQDNGDTVLQVLTGSVFVINQQAKGMQPNPESNGLFILNENDPKEYNIE
jgi:hypothetical protein